MPPDAPAGTEPRPGYDQQPIEVAALAEAAGLPAVPCAGVEEALRLLRERQWRVAPRVLIAGSLYLAGEVLSLNGTVPT